MKNALEQTVLHKSDERKKEYFEYIIGFLALVLTLSNFKSELEAVKIDAGWLKFSLSAYLMWLVVYVVAVLHLFFIPFFIRSEKFGKVKSGILATVYSLLFIATVSPLIILLSAIARIINLEILASLVSLATIGFNVIAIIRFKYQENQDKIYERKLRDLVPAIVLSNGNISVGKDKDWIRIDPKTRRIARQILVLSDPDDLIYRILGSSIHDEILHDQYLKVLDVYFSRFAKERNRSPIDFGIEATSESNDNGSDSESPLKSPEK